MMRLAIDPGHPSFVVDTGATAPGLIESEYTWQLACGLSAYIRHTLSDVEPFLLRNSISEVVSLEERGRRSKKHDADLVISLHVNWSDNPWQSGPMLFYWPDNIAGMHVAEAIAQAMPYPFYRPSPHRVYATRNCSINIKYKWMRAARNVLMQHEATSVLLEVGHCSNEVDKKAMLDNDTQIGIMLAIMLGVTRFKQMTKEQA